MLPEHTNRIAVLDSVRGVAALTVVLHHFLVSTPMFWTVYTSHPKAAWAVALLAYSPIHLLWGGLEAVLLFFVLSGFVLAIPFQRGAVSSYSSFAIKRVCRIYIPYILAVFIGCLFLNATESHSVPELSGWFNQFWNQAAGWRAVLDHLFMLGTGRWNYVNPVVWSLVHEMRVSLVFPALMWLVFRYSWRMVTPLALLLSLGAKTGMAHVNGDSLIHSLLETTSYLFLFAAGAELSVHRKAIRVWFTTQNSWVKSTLILFALLLLNARWETPGRFAPLVLIASWTGAIAVIGISAVDPWVTGVLDCAPFRWLGRVSYSLYLTHVIVLFAVIYLTRGILPVTSALLVAFPLALAFSEVYYRSVEAGSIGLGRALSSRFGRPAALANLAPVPPGEAKGALLSLGGT